MEMLSKVRIGTRLAAAFALMLLLLAVMSISALTQAGRLQANTEYYEADLLPALKTISAFYQGVSDARRTTFLLITLGDAKEIAKVEQRYAGELKLAREQLEAYEQQGLIYDDRDRALWADLKQRLAVWTVEHEKVLEANRRRLQDPSQADVPRQLVLGEARVVNLALIKAKDDWQRYRDEVALQVLQRGRDTYRAVLWLLGSVAAIALVAGVAASVAITRSITRPLAQAMAITNAVADGDLTQRVETSAKDELGDLLTALTRMSSRLREMVESVRGSTEAIASASAQIARGNGDLSSRTEQQAASLQQTAASMQQMAAAVRSSSENAQTASELSSAASDVAQRGGQAVSEVVESMAGIQGASRRIADIISVIDGIAFQTNILALMRPWRPRAPVSRDAALPLWRPRCAIWRSAARRPRARSRR